MQIDANTKVADVLRVFELLKYDISAYEGNLANALEEAAQKLEASLEKESYKK